MGKKTDGNGIELSIEVPGASAEDLVVEIVNESLLRVSGSRKHHEDGSVMEATFEKVFELGDDIDVDSLTVHLASGILRISAANRERIVRKVDIVVEEKTDGEFEAEAFVGQVDTGKLGSDSEKSDDQEKDGITISEGDEV